MDESIGRTPEPTTDTPPPDPIQRARDVLPPVEYEGTPLSDPDARQRSVDPLDPHAPSRETNDPLDPDGHVI
jgi:hypothetical protein